MSRPRKKKEKRKRKSRPGPTCQPLTLLLLCFPPRAAARVVRRRPSSASAPRAVHRRVPCRPSLLPSPSPYPRRSRPRSPPQTLARFPRPPLPRRPSSRRRRDSPSPVSVVSIPRVGSFLASSSSDSGANPAPSPPLQGRRRSPSPAAAPVRRAASPLPLSARALAGEVRRRLLLAVRAFPGPRQPSSARPLHHRRRRRAVARAPRAWARPGAGSRRVLALTGLGGAPARGTHLSASGLAGVAAPGGPSNCC